MERFMVRKRWRNILVMILVAGFAVSCVQQTGSFKKRLSKVREKKRELSMKQSGMSKYLEGIDDTALIVFVSVVDDYTQIHTITPAGEDMKQLTDTLEYKCRPVWNLEHTKIAFFQYDSDSPIGDKIALIAMNADGTEIKSVAKDKKIKARDMRLSWKPDSSVLYVQEKDFPTILYGYDVQTGLQRETIRLPKNSFMTEVHSLSPDMQYLAGSGPSKHDNVSHIGNIRKDGKLETDLMKPFNQVPYHLGTVVWAYDSHLVAFELDKIIMVMSKRFSLDFEAYPLTPQDFAAELSGPAFSPSGKKMACIMEKVSEGNVGSGDQEVSSDVWVMNLDGTRQRKITKTGSCFDPHW
ncbi:hypothetical protein K8S19_05225 [bacterium]|nr:hypothetical protein [bacterium]